MTVINDHHLVDVWIYIRSEHYADNSSTGVSRLTYRPPLSVRNMDVPKGTMMYVVFEWTFIIFYNAADCELLYHQLLSPDHDFNYSRNGLAGVYNMESIQNDPLGHPVPLRATGHSCLCSHRHL